jgi:hypothetical protein
MPGERRGRQELGRAFTFVGLRRDRLATAAVLLAIAVSLAGACVVILEATAEPPPKERLTIAAAG